jgi:hypothetical protein
VPVIDLAKDLVPRTMSGVVLTLHEPRAGTPDDISPETAYPRPRASALASVYARAIADDARNLTGAELGEIRASGGVVAASFEETRIMRGRTAALHVRARGF